MLNLTQVVAEPTSAILCFILVWFMLKPYKLTGEISFLALPLGFGIMGIGHIIATPAAYFTDLSWFMLLFRTFSFVFLALTYFLSGRTSKTRYYFGNLAISSLIVVLILLSFIIVVSPEQVWASYGVAGIYCRIFIGICLLYIIFKTIKNHLAKPDPDTLWIPLGFILLAISQYSFILYYINQSYANVLGGLIFRFSGLIIFLLVAYRTFFNEKEFK